MSPAILIETRESSVWQKALSLPVVVCGLLVCLTFCFCCLRFNDPDTWWHLKMGEEILRSHAIPRSDHWSFTVYGKPWMAHEWLAQVSIYLAYAFGGYAGLQLWLCGLASAIVAVMYVLCYRYCGNPAVAAVGGFLTFFFGTIGFAVRPKCIGYLFLGIELLLLERAWSGRPRALWFLPPLFAIWVNCHGSYPLGIGILLAAGLCSYLDARKTGFHRQPDVRLLALVAAASLGALLLNPVGLRLLEYPFDVFLRQRTSLEFIEEWLPLTVLDVRGIGVLAVLAGMLVAGLTTSAKASRFELLVLLPVTYLAMRHTRMVFAFAMVAPPIVCRMLAGLRPSRDRKPDHLPTNAFLLLLAAVSCYAAFPSLRVMETSVEENNPVKAVQFIRTAGLQGPMMHSSRWGGYLIWALPEHKVFVDGRADIYDWAGVLRRYHLWAAIESDPAELLNDYHINFCLLQTSDPIAYVMPHLLGWKRVYRDDVAVIFVREHPWDARAQESGAPANHS
jgi:hypothetical protein